MIDYDFTKQADRQFCKLPAEIQARIIEKLKFYLTSPRPFIFAKFIRREKDVVVYRFRIGAYRLIFDWDGKIVLVTQVRPRNYKGIYK